MADAQSSKLFPLLLRDVALSWFNDRFPDGDNDLKDIVDAFNERFALFEPTKWRHRSDVWQRQQQPKESVDKYMSDMQTKGTLLNMAADELRDAVIQGLRSELRAFVVQREPKNLADVFRASRLAESTIEPAQAVLADQLKKSIHLMEKLETVAFAGYDDHQPRTFGGVDVRHSRWRGNRENRPRSRCHDNRRGEAIGDRRSDANLRGVDRSPLIGRRTEWHSRVKTSDSHDTWNTACKPANGRMNDFVTCSRKAYGLVGGACDASPYVADAGRSQVQVARSS